VTMQLIIPGLSTPTTKLGYGCSQLMGGITFRQSIALLDAAFDAGIRHYDTAPSYGYGQAEKVLGAAFRSKRDQVTITTKFGIRPPRNQGALELARRLALPVVRLMPGVKARLFRAAGGLSGRSRFSPHELRASIAASLAALDTDYIDIILLHEALVGDLSDELFDELERSVAAGKIRNFGIGSEVAAIKDIHRAEPRFCPIMQFEWSVLSLERPNYSGSFLVTHRSLSESLVRLRAGLGANPQLCQSWSRRLGADLSDVAVLSRLMLAAARDANPQGITLFSSRNLQNIRTNAELLLGSATLEAGAALARLVANEAAFLAPPSQSAAAASG
jgi:D-threo-aldose 1-dehydrogenase